MSLYIWMNVDIPRCSDWALLGISTPSTSNEAHLYVPQPHICSSSSIVPVASMSASVCRHYGTPAGCRAGKKCRDLHITHDGSLANTRASPVDPTRARDEFRVRLHEHLNSYLAVQGGAMQVNGMAFTRDGHLRVRCKVSGGQGPSERAKNIATGKD